MVAKMMSIDVDSSPFFATNLSSKENVSEIKKTAGMLT